MNLMQHFQPRSTRGTCLPTRPVAAFTLPEMIISMAVFMLVVMVIISVQLFGLKLNQIAATKLIAGANGRKVLNQVRSDIQSAQSVTVVNGDNTGQTNLPDNQMQIGNAVRICQTTNKAVFQLLYYTANGVLNRFDNTAGTIKTVAKNFTNSIAFQSEDFSGTILTNNDNNRVIRVKFDFYQFNFAARGTNLYDYFRMETRATCRMNN